MLQTAPTRSLRPLMVQHRDKPGVARHLQGVLDSFSARPRSFNISPKVHGSSPLGNHYPAFGLELSFSLSLSFPPDIPDDIASQPDLAVRSLVASLDVELSTALAAAGYGHLRPYWDEAHTGFSFAHHFPPVFGNETPEVLRCFRKVAPGDETFGSPFSDEQFITIRYAGINMWRVTTWLPAPTQD